MKKKKKKKKVQRGSMMKCDLDDVKDRAVRSQLKDQADEISIQLEDWKYLLYEVWVFEQLAR
jgi:hypothetical protein